MDRPPSKRGPQPDPNSAKSKRLAKRKTEPGAGRRPSFITTPTPTGFMLKFSPYSQEVGAEIVYRIAMGHLMSHICADKGMPSVDTVYHWIAQIPSFSDSIARAREASAHALVEQTREIADDPGISASHEEIGRARLRIDTRKWMASKYKPQAYGDKLDVTADLQLTVNIKRFTPTTIDQPIDIIDDPGKS